MHAKSDADHTIAQTARQCAQHQTTAFTGEDTDVLVLLAHHANAAANDTFSTLTNRVQTQNIRA